MQINSERINPERAIAWFLLILLGVGCFLVLKPFLSALLWAVILTYASWPGFVWLRTRLRLAPSWVALLMTLGLACLVVVPLAIVAPASSQDVNTLMTDLRNWVSAGPPQAPDWLANVPLVGHEIAQRWNDITTDLSRLLDLLSPYTRTIAETSVSILLGIAGGVMEFAVALFLAFFLFVYGEQLAEWLETAIDRVGGKRARHTLNVAGATVRGTVYGILGTAVVQGILTALGLWAVGVPSPVLLGVIAGLISVLPIGAPVVWIPAAIWLLLRGDVWLGIGLALYGGLIISSADNLIRPWFIARGANLPFLLTILGVLGGVVAFGFLGIFLGPVLLGVGYTVVNEWLREEPMEQPSQDETSD